MKRFQALWRVPVAVGSVLLAGLGAAALPSLSGGCVIDPNADAGTDAGSDAAAPVCDGRGICDECQACANGVCAAQIQACEGHSVCLSIAACVRDCAELGCPDTESCYATDPDGQGTALYQAVSQCIFCQTCRSDCAGRYPCAI